MIEYVKKADVLDIINSPLPRDIAVDYQPPSEEGEENEVSGGY